MTAEELKAKRLALGYRSRNSLAKALGVSKYAVEHWRRSMPRGMGTLYWQLNDCWPVASWSSIDSLGRWKALHYMARQIYAPELVSAVEDAGSGAVELHLTNDLRQPSRGTLAWRLTDVAGRSLAQ